jgi:hypothetical protein
VQTRLALAERQTHYSFDAFHHNRVIILRPAGMSEAVGRQFRIKAQALLDQRTGNSPSEQHIPLCIQLIAELVTAISQANHTVGPRWSVGLHLARNNTTNISNVGDDVNAMRWH